MSRFREYTEAEMSFFMPTIIESIKPLLDDIEDNIPVLHVPAVLSWLLDVEFVAFSPASDSKF